MSEGSWRDGVIKDLGAHESDQSASRPKAMPVHDWLERCRQTSELFLEQSPDEVEASLQGFLERHQPCVPWASDAAHQGLAKYRNRLVTQPRLHGDYDQRIPDFMWVSTSSATTYVRLIEIERANKLWFNPGDGTSTAHFTEAQGQLLQWKRLLREPAAQERFLRAFEINDLIGPTDPTREPKLEYRLLYGRRKEFTIAGPHGTRRNELNRGRQDLNRADEEYNTIDSITEAPDLRTAQAYTVKRTSHSTWRIVALPPSFTIGPNVAPLLYRCEGWEDAVRAMGEPDVDGQSVVTPERIAYLLKRVAYWKSTYANHNGRWIPVGPDLE